MAEIRKAIRYSSEQQKLINSRLGAPNFSHLNWQDEDLQPLRRALRDHYRQEQRGLCAYCRESISLTSPQNAHVEHIAPKAKYGQFIFEPKNLCVICADCSAIKQSQDVLTSPDPLRRQVKRYPRGSTAFYIVHPHFDRWDDHILKVHGFYVDRTPKGHFTIGACVLNRKIRRFGWDNVLTESASAAEAVRRLIEGAEPRDRAAALASLIHALLPTSSVASTEVSG